MKSRIIEICVSQICVNQGVSVYNNMYIIYNGLMEYTANVYRGLQGDQGVFLQYLQGKHYDNYRISLQSVNITGFSLQILQKNPLITL